MGTSSLQLSDIVCTASMTPYVFFHWGILGLAAGGVFLLFLCWPRLRRRICGTYSRSILLILCLLFLCLSLRIEKRWWGDGCTFLAEKYQFEVIPEGLFGFPPEKSGFKYMREDN